MRAPSTALRLVLALGLCLTGASTQARTRPAPVRQPAPAATSPAVAAPQAQDGKTTTARHAMVAAANPLAVQAGLKVLREGGSAVDAAVAVQLVLGLVEPQSSGVGGGAFMTYYDARTRTVSAYDGREVAPAGASADMFLGPDGKPLPFGQAVVSGRATGVPGAIAMLALAQKDHGARPWSSLFGDAAALADQGFIVTPRLANYIASNFPESTTPDVVAYFTKADGTKYQIGDRLKNPAYASTLRRLAAEGPSAILKGSIAADIVAKTHMDPLPGTMTLADLAAYQPQASQALCRPYRVYQVCAPQLPSGGVGVLELLGILQTTDIATRGPNDPQAWFEFVEASRLAYADRDHYAGDPKFVRVPEQGLLDPAYEARRAQLIGTQSAKAVSFGAPMGAVARGPDATVEPGGTSSFVVVDAKGNVVSMTTTVESLFGTGRMVDGFFLNNQLTDFSFSPTDPTGAPAANAVGPGKRPRSSMSPTIVLDKDGRFVAALGSPGGNAIIAYVAKALVGYLDWKLPLGEAINLPNVIARGDTVVPEGAFDPKVLDALRARGMNIGLARNEESGLHGVVARPEGGYEGAADTRREGVALGF